MHRTADDEAEQLCLRTGIGKACIRRCVTCVDLAKRCNRTDGVTPQQRDVQLENVFVWLIGLLLKSDAANSGT
jgi:hypothetical protein